MMDNKNPTIICSDRKNLRFSSNWLDWQTASCHWQKQARMLELDSIIIGVH